MTSVQELEDCMAKGITGTGEGFDAPSAGRLGGSGFGAHNISLMELRGKMMQVRPCSMSQEATHSNAPVHPPGNCSLSWLPSLTEITA
jgi:hypothetical protein